MVPTIKWARKAIQIIKYGDILWSTNETMLQIYLFTFFVGESEYMDPLVKVNHTPLESPWETLRTLLFVLSVDAVTIPSLTRCTKIIDE